LETAAKFVKILGDKCVRRSISEAFIAEMNNQNLESAIPDLSVALETIVTASINKKIPITSRLLVEIFTRNAIDLVYFSKIDRH
jgi:hypothetical protein